MKKIFIILPDLGNGGAEKLSVNLFQEWSKLNFDVYFVLIKKAGIFAKKIPKKKIFILKEKNFINSIFKLKKIFSEKKPDFILSSMWPLTSITVLSWLLSGRSGKLFLSDHTIISQSAKYEIKYPLILIKYVMRLTYKYANGIIAVSKAVKTDLKKLLNFKNEEHIKVIYNPITKNSKLNLKLNEEEKRLSKKIWGNYKFKILNVGKLKTQKNHKLLIEAILNCKNIKNIRLVIVGTGELMNQLKKKILSHNLDKNILLLGHRQDLKIYYKTADLFVLTSDWEGFSNVTAEALEYGLPVITTDYRYGPVEILDKGKYGTIINSKKSQNLTIAIDQNLKKKHDRKKLFNRSKIFNIKKISNSYLNFFKNDF